MEEASKPAIKHTLCLRPRSEAYQPSSPQTDLTEHSEGQDQLEIIRADPHDEPGIMGVLAMLFSPSSKFLTKEALRVRGDQQSLEGLKETT